MDGFVFMRQCAKLICVFAHATETVIACPSTEMMIGARLTDQPGPRAHRENYIPISVVDSIDDRSHPTVQMTLAKTTATRKLNKWTGEGDRARVRERFESL